MIVDLFTDEPLGDTWNADYKSVLVAFQEVALLSGSADANLDEILRLIARRLCALLQASRCSIYLRHENGVFRGQVGYCGGRNIDAAVHGLLAGEEGDTFTAEIVSTLRPVVIRKATSDSRTIQRTMRRWGVRDILGVPLVVDRSVIGIIFLDNQSSPHAYSDHHIWVAQAFAGLCALAVRQASLYRQLRERARIIDQQQNALGECNFVHSRVTRAVLDGLAVEEIVGLISGLLGRPVVFYGPELDVRSRATRDPKLKTLSPGGETEASREQIRVALQGVRSDEPSLMIRATPELGYRRLLSPMVVNGQCVGYLELCEVGRPFSQVDRRAVEHAAMALSLKLLAVQRSEELRRQQSEALFSNLILGRWEPGMLSSSADEIGIHIANDHIVVRLQHGSRPGERKRGGAAARDGLIFAVTQALPGDCAVVAHTTVPGADLLLIEIRVRNHSGPEATDEAIERSIDIAMADLVARYDVCQAIVSERCRSIDQIPEAVDKLRHLASVLRASSQHTRVATSRRLDLVRLLSRRSGLGGAARYSESLLAPLAAYDAENGSSLVDTLRTYIECDAQIRPSALLLNVHENTVRYRLTKIRDISDIVPDRLESLAKVVLALQVRDLCGGASPLATLQRPMAANCPSPTRSP